MQVPGIHTTYASWKQLIWSTDATSEYTHAYWIFTNNVTNFAQLFVNSSNVSVMNVSLPTYYLSRMFKMYTSCSNTGLMSVCCIWIRIWSWLLNLSIIKTLKNAKNCSNNITTTALSARVVRWLDHSDAMCSRVWHALCSAGSRFNLSRGPG